MKKALFFLVIMLLCSCAYADEYSDIDALMPSEADFSFSDAVASLMEGNSPVKGDELWGKVCDFALSQVRINISSVAAVFAVSLLLSLLTSMQNDFGKKGGGDAAFLIVYMIVTGILAASFGEISKTGITLIDNTVIFTNTAVPLLGASIASSGNIGVYGALAPTILIFANLTGNIIRKIGLPAVYFSLSISLIGNMSDRFSLAPIGKVIRNASIWIIGAAVTIFCSLIAISGMSAGAINGAVLKGAKFAVGSMVPVLGGMLADSIEAVTGSAVILKNAIGAAGVVFLGAMVLFPIIKIAVTIFLYRVAAAVMGVFCDKRIVNVLNDMAGVLGCIIGFIVACSVAALISITVLINSSNMGVMLR